MQTVAIVIHISTCVLLIGVVLLQQGKGAEMGAVFGGSSSTIFGSGGAGNFLTRLTTGLAIVFMLTSLTLTYTSTHHLSSSVFDSGPLGEPPPLAPNAGAPAPGAQAPAEGAPAAAAPEAAAPAAEAAPAAAPEAAAPAPAAPAAEPQAAAH